MRNALLIGVAGAAAAFVVSGAAQAADRFEIREAAARVTVVPEARGDVKVEVTKHNGALPMRMWVDGDTVKVEGNLERNAIRGCEGYGKTVSVRIRDKGQIAYDDLPHMIVRVPMDAEVSASGAVFGEVRNGGSLRLGNAGCGDWRVGDMRGRMALRSAGSGETVAGRSGSLEVRIAGSGSVEAGPSSGDVDVNIAGSGDAHVAAVGGVLVAKIAGSGDIRVDGGSASRMEAAIAGSGDVDFNGAAGSLKASIAGSGDVRALRVSGPVERRVIGSGSIRVGQ